MGSMIALILVVIMTAISIGVAIYSRRWTRTTAEFYVAGRQISWIENALALTGDYLSAASFLGVAGGICMLGIDKVWDALGYFGGYIVLLFLLAVPLRNLGKYTAAEIITTRFKSKTLRIMAMIGTVLICAFYLVPQMLGAGALLQLLLDWDYVFAEIVVGILIMVYVTIGGMRATTYNQIIQAFVLWGAMFCILGLTAATFYGFNPVAILTTADGIIPPQLAANLLQDNPNTPNLADMSAQEVVNFVINNNPEEKARGLTPGTFAPDWLNTFSLAMGIVFGTAGLPHILMRYYTVKKGKDARTSTLGVLASVGTFYIMSTFVGFAAMYLLYPDLVGLLLAGEASVAKNMVVPMMANLVGGEWLMGIACAGAFAAILSTVAGLIITATTSLTHDLYKMINPNASEKKELFVAKSMTIFIGMAAIVLALVLKGQNVSFLVTLAFGIAASIFFPVLSMCVWWRAYTREGALATMVVGLIVSVSFVAAKLANMEMFLGLPVLVNPGLYSIPAAFLAGIIVSLLTTDRGRVDEFLAKAHRSS